MSVMIALRIAWIQLAIKMTADFVLSSLPKPVLKRRRLGMFNHDACHSGACRDANITREQARREANFIPHLYPSARIQKNAASAMVEA